MCWSSRFHLSFYGKPSAKRTPRCTNCWEVHHFSKDCTNQKDARCANLKVTCQVTMSTSSFLMQNLMSLRLLVRTTVCATSTSSASAVGLRNTHSSMLRLCTVGISQEQRRFNQQKHSWMRKKREIYHYFHQFYRKSGSLNDWNHRGNSRSSSSFRWCP